MRQLALKPSTRWGRWLFPGGRFQAVFICCAIQFTQAKFGAIQHHHPLCKLPPSSTAPPCAHPFIINPHPPPPPPQGLFSANHRRLKIASLVNTAVSLAACPAIVHLSDASPVARALVAAGVVGFGVGTTAGLHWFTSPYVHELQRSSGGGSSGSGEEGEGRQRLRARTLNMLGGARWAEFDLAEVEHPNSLRPLATFKVGAARGACFSGRPVARADGRAAVGGLVASSVSQALAWGGGSAGCWPILVGGSDHPDHASTIVGTTLRYI